MIWMPNTVRSSIRLFEKNSCHKMEASFLHANIFYSSYIYIYFIVILHPTVFAILKKLIIADVVLIHYQTDSSSSQYRNKYIFNIVWQYKSFFITKTPWNYLIAGHGKGTCDGLRGSPRKEWLIILLNNRNISFKMLLISLLGLSRLKYPANFFTHLFPAKTQLSVQKKNP